MAKLRSVNTRFWDDPFIEELDIEDKLIFLYLLTNPLTNTLGIYEISIKRICYDTGAKKERVLKALERFGSRVIYVDGFIVLRNFLKNQNLNANMKTGAVKIFDDLPNSLKDKLMIKDSKGFESLSNALKIEYNRIEDKEEYKGNDNPYEQWVKNSSEAYQGFVLWLHEENPSGEPLKNVLSLEGQISEKSFDNLMKKYPKEEIKNVILSMEAKDLSKYKIKNFVVALNTWLRK